MIFYFTATGNSKYIAELIASKTNDRLINITDCVNGNRFDFTSEKGEAVGFSVPVYYFGIPMIVIEFLQKLHISSSAAPYTYAVLNCGGSMGNAEKLIRKNIDLDAFFGIKAIDNYVVGYKTETDEAKQADLDRVEQEMSVLTNRIINKEKGTFNALRGTMPRLLTAVAYPLYKNGRKTDKFTVSDACTSCGLCAKICPRKVVELENGKPAWTKPQCELCLGCLNRCPASAINYGKRSASNGRYVNPRVKF